jgi:hypothetical protein
VDKKPRPEPFPDGTDFAADPPPVTPEQRRELKARLEHHRRHPDEPTVTLDEIRRKLLRSLG